MENLHFNIILKFYFFFTAALTFNDGIPVRKNEPWSMLLCQFFDVPEETQSKSFFEQWLTDTAKMGTVANYFNTVSGGLYTINGSNVHGWFRLPYSQAQIKDLATKDPKLVKYGSVEHRTPHKVAELCLRAAKFHNFQLEKKVITIINAGRFAIFTADHGILLSPAYIMTSALVHEMVHSFNIGHSFSDRPVKIYKHAKLGEYDDRFDLMSTSNAFMFESYFGFNGPGLSGPHLDYLGWLPVHRMHYFNTTESSTFEISSLGIDRGVNTKPLLLIIPNNPQNPLEFITVEYRTRSGVDLGIEANSLVLHKVQNKSGILYSYLLTRPDRFGLIKGNTYFRFWQELDCKFTLRIKVVATNHQTATVEIHKKLKTEACFQRKITSPASAALEKQKLSPDHSKNIPFTKKIKREANTADSLSKNPKTFGVNKCKEPYVWRLIDSHDYTCVHPSVKQRIELQTLRQVHQNSSTACRSGYRPRNALHGDAICVRDAEYKFVQADKQMAISRLLYNKFFNGVDEIR